MDSKEEGYIERKMINGCGPYLYLRYRVDGKLRSKYLGKEPQSHDQEQSAEE